MKQEMNQHRCNSIGCWDYMVKRINRTRYSAIVSAYLMHWTTENCTRALSRTSTIFCVLPLFRDYAVAGAGKAQVRFIGTARLWDYCPLPLFLISLTPHISSALSALCCSRAGCSVTNPAEPCGPCWPLWVPTVELITQTSSGANADLRHQWERLFPTSKTKNEHLHCCCSWKASIPFRSSSAHLLGLFCIGAVAALALRFLIDSPTLEMSRRANIFSFGKQLFYFILTAIHH